MPGTLGDGARLKLYLAGPLFNDIELAFNERFTTAIEALGYEVFLAQRDGVEDDALADTSDRDWAQAIFENDRDAVFECDVLVCVLNGRVPDEGMALEMGLGYANRLHNKPGRKLIGFSTDRRIFTKAGINAMLSGALDELYNEEASLLGRLAEILADQ